MKGERGIGRERKRHIRGESYRTTYCNAERCKESEQKREGGERVEGERKGGIGRWK